MKRYYNIIIMLEISLVSEINILAKIQSMLVFSNAYYRTMFERPVSTDLTLILHGILYFS